MRFARASLVFGYLSTVIIVMSIAISVNADEDNLPAPALAIEHRVVEDVPMDSLPESLIALLSKNKVPADNLSIYVRDLNSKQPLLEHNVDIMRSPASTVKLITTFAALKQLGPNYAWRTEAWHRGDIENGILKGDLILKGHGDPFMVYERYWKFVHELHDKGLREITGNVIIDNSYYDLPDHDNDAFDGQGFRVYNAGASPLMFNFQATRLMIKPPEDEAATLADIIPFPPSSALTIDNQVALVKGRCKRQHGRPKLSWSPEKQLIVKGQFSVSCKPRYLMRNLSDPTQHAFDAFKHFWTELGGKLHGGLKAGQINGNDELFHSYSSPTLGEQIRLINKWSNNVMTRQLLLTIGANRFGAPATLDKGRDAVLETLKKQGVDTTNMVVDNGSGLSRKARVSARQMSQLLEVAYRDAYMPEFMSSMSLPGLDGTLASRFKSDDQKGRSHLKTGTLNSVTAIAGYMLNRKGRRLVIVVQHNGSRATSARGGKIQDEILRWAFEQ